MASSDMQPRKPLWDRSGGCGKQHRLVLIGSLRLLDPAGVDVTPAARKLCAMLGYLALVPAKASRREQVMSLLWSESGERQARDSLRQCLMALRRVEALVGRPLMLKGNEFLQLAADVTIDVEELEVEIGARRTAKLPRLLGQGQPGPARGLRGCRSGLRGLAADRARALCDQNRSKDDRADPRPPDIFG